MEGGKPVQFWLQFANFALYNQIRLTWDNSNGDYGQQDIPFAYFSQMETLCSATNIVVQDESEAPEDETEEEVEDEIVVEEELFTEDLQRQVV